MIQALMERLYIRLLVVMTAGEFGFYLRQEVIFISAFVCVCICLSAHCLCVYLSIGTITYQMYYKNIKRITTKICGNDGHCPRTN